MLKPFGIVSANLKISRDPVTGREAVAKGYKQETFTDAWVRYLPLPATFEEKGPENPGKHDKRGVAAQVAVARGNPLPEGERGGVADNCRYRYPNATEREAKKGPFSAETKGEGAGGSGVAEKKEGP